MIIEEREYVLRAGERDAFWAIYQAQGVPIQLRYLHCPLGFYFVDIGATLNFVHMWPYDSHADRETRRERLHHDPDWQAYMPISHRYIVEIRTRILRSLEWRAPE